MKVDIAKVAAELTKLRKKMAPYELKLAPLKKEEKELEDQLRVGMLEQAVDSLSTKSITFSLQHTQIAVLTDDIKFFEYVAKHKAWDLLRRQPAIEACRQRWEDALEIPGVKAENRVTLRSTARKR